MKKKAVLHDSRIRLVFVCGLTSQTAGREPALRRTSSPVVSVLSSPLC